MAEPVSDANGNGGIARLRIPPLTSFRPITPDDDAATNTPSAAGAALLSRGVDTSAIDGIGGNVDFTA